jgi:hypothetical protein
VRHFGQRVRLVHELRKLRASEELLDRGHHGLRVDEIVRHGGRHFLVDRHLFLDRALHADESDPELVLEQLSHAANAAISQVVDVVHFADAFPQLEHVAKDFDEVLARRRAVLALLHRSWTSAGQSFSNMP